MSAPSWSMRRGMQALLWLIIACGGLSFAFFFCVSPTPWYSTDGQKLVAFRGGLLLRYRPSASITGSQTPLLDGDTSFVLIWQWCAILAVALPAALLLKLRSCGLTAAADPSCPPAGTGPAASNQPTPPFPRPSLMRRARRLLSYRVPPRGAWRSMLGPDGLSLLDLLLVLMWVGLHVMWLYTATKKQLDQRAATLASAAVQSSPEAPTSSSSGAVAASAAADEAALAAEPLSQFIADNLSLVLGAVGRLDVLLLFFPLPRCNFLAWLLGAEWGTLIKYHKWLGHGTMTVYSLHGVMYMSLWAQQHVLAQELAWVTSDVNNRAGLIALAGGWLLWLTAMEPVRRRLFNQVFYPCHLAGALVFMLFSFMHVTVMAPWVLPGVFLYLLDVALRNLQPFFAATTVTTAANATLAPDGSIVTLALPAAESLEWCGGDVVFIKVPSVSRWQWHPFTLSSPSSACPGAYGGAAGRAMVLRIKRYDRWTKRFLSLLASDPSPHTLYVSGPHAPPGARTPADAVRGYDHVVMLAGGIGVSTLLPALLEAAARRRAAGDAPHRGGGASATSPTPRRVTFLWTSRSPAELGALPAVVAQEAARQGRDAWLRVRLFLTSGRPRSTAAAAGDAPHNAASSGAIELRVAPGTAESLDAGAASAGGVRPPALWHPYVAGPLTWAAAALLAFGGGFAGLLAAQAYNAHQDRTVPLRNDLHIVGMLQFAALTLGAMLPPAYLMLCVHARIYRNARIAARGGGPAALPAAASAQQPLKAWASGGDCASAPPCHLAAHAGPSAYSLASTAPSASTSSLGTACGAGAMGGGAGSPRGAATRGSSGGALAAAAFDVARVAGAAALSPLIEYGRPDMAAVLRAAAEEAGAAAAGSGGSSGDATVGVFVGGPAALVAATLEAAAAVNGLWGGRDGRAYLEVHSVTYEL